MEITRFGHASVLVEVAGTRVLIDPGVFSSDEAFALEGLDAIVVTHQHPDHIDVNRGPGLLERNPAAVLLADPESAAVLEFGAPWCGHCIAAQQPIETALATHPDVHHLKIEDGRGKPLGRSFRIKLWPTLVFLRDGQYVTTLSGMLDWDVYVERVGQALAMPASRARATGCRSGGVVLGK